MVVKGGESGAGDGGDGVGGEEGAGEGRLPLKETERGVAENGRDGREAGDGVERVKLGKSRRGVGIGGLLLGMNGGASGLRLSLR